AGVGPEQQHGAELGRSQEAQRQAVVGELEHQQHLGDLGEPRAHLRDELAAEEEAEVPHPEGAERVEGAHDRAVTVGAAITSSTAAPSAAIVAPTERLATGSIEASAAWRAAAESSRVSALDARRAARQP